MFRVIYFSGPGRLDWNIIIAWSLGTVHAFSLLFLGRNTTPVMEPSVMFLSKRCKARSLDLMVITSKELFRILICICIPTSLNLLLCWLKCYSIEIKGNGRSFCEKTHWCGNAAMCVASGHMVWCVSWVLCGIFVMDKGEMKLKAWGMSGGHRGLFPWLKHWTLLSARRAVEKKVLKT